MKADRVYVQDSFLLSRLGRGRDKHLTLTSASQPRFLSSFSVALTREQRCVCALRRWGAATQRIMPRSDTSFMKWNSAEHGVQDTEVLKIHLL